MMYIERRRDDYLRLVDSISKTHHNHVLLSFFIRKSQAVADEEMEKRWSFLMRADEIMVRMMMMMTGGFV